MTQLLYSRDAGQHVFKRAGVLPLELYVCPHQPQSQTSNVTLLCHLLETVLDKEWASQPALPW